MLSKTKENSEELEQKAVEKKKLLQWHPAFYAGLQIEFGEEADKLIFKREYNLSTKPMQIDVLVIKKKTTATRCIKSINLPGWIVALCERNCNNLNYIKINPLK